MLEIEAVRMEFPADANIIVGQLRRDRRSESWTKGPISGVIAANAVLGHTNLPTLIESSEKVQRTGDWSRLEFARLANCRNGGVMEQPAHRQGT